MTCTAPEYDYLKMPEIETGKLSAPVDVVLTAGQGADERKSPPWSTLQFEAPSVSSLCARGDSSANCSTLTLSTVGGRRANVTGIAFPGLWQFAVPMSL